MSSGTFMVRSSSGEETEEDAYLHAGKSAEGWTGRGDLERRSEGEKIKYETHEKDVKSYTYEIENHGKVETKERSDGGERSDEIVTRSLENEVKSKMTQQDHVEWGDHGGQGQSYVELQNHGEKRRDRVEQGDHGGELDHDEYEKQDHVGWGDHAGELDNDEHEKQDHVE